jgi:hypothetical protein
MNLAACAALQSYGQLSKVSSPHPPVVCITKGPTAILYVYIYVYVYLQQILGSAGGSGAPTSFLAFGLYLTPRKHCAGAHRSHLGARKHCAGALRSHWAFENTAQVRSGTTGRSKQLQRCAGKPLRHSKTLHSCAQGPLGRSKTLRRWHWGARKHRNGALRDHWAPKALHRGTQEPLGRSTTTGVLKLIVRNRSSESLPRFHFAQRH